MKIKYLIFALLTLSTILFASCNDSTPNLEIGEALDSVNIANESKDTGKLLELCKYQYPNGDGFLSEPCEGSIFIKRLSGEGKIRYDSTLNGYIISTGIDGTYDCTIITLFCGDYKDLVGKEINYTCDYYEYNGLFEPPLGGMEVFVGKNIKYSIK